MTTGVEKVLYSRTGLALAVFLARSMPARLGYGIAGRAAKLVAAQHQSALVQAVRANQWVAGEEKLSAEVLEERVKAVFNNIGRAIYEVYHFMQDPATAGRLFVLEPSFQAYLPRPEFEPPGLVVVGLHMGSFDLALQWICHQWLKPVFLTIPHPLASQQLEFEIRKRTGMNWVPATLSGMKQAVRYLTQGGLVVTGIDHPVPDSQPKPRFFGRVADLPIHHIYLALKARAPVVMVVNRREEDGKYHIYATPKIEMERISNRSEELLCNAEKLLSMAEDFIRQAPEQWTITRPVWPNLMGQVPNLQLNPTHK